jgi:hypothetical protein
MNLKKIEIWASPEHKKGSKLFANKEYARLIQSFKWGSILLFQFCCPLMLDDIYETELRRIGEMDQGRGSGPNFRCSRKKDGKTQSVNTSSSQGLFFMLTS